VQSRFDILDADESSLADRIAARLSHPKALPNSRARMSLAYGRHRGPAPLGTRMAAVVVALYRDSDGGWTIPLTLRPRTLQHHGGQISLPGGRIESGEDAYRAAMREFEEELGRQPAVLHRCGELSTQYVYASANLVHPLVTVVDRPQFPWRPDPVEVEQVVELPVRVLLDPGYRVIPTRTMNLRRDGGSVGTVAVQTPAIEFGSHHIWGATALILDQLAQILHDID